MHEKSDVHDMVLLTADRTLMSDYHANEFIGFGTCAPPNVIPNWLYSWLFFPPIKTRKGMPTAAPYGLRKVEAKLLSQGFNVYTVAPTHLKKFLDKAKVLGIYVMDPFGLGPASSTFAAILKKEPFLAQHFRALLSQNEVRAAKKKGLKIIVGGPGVWQFNFKADFIRAYGIDCIVHGEAEKIIGKIVQAAINNEPLPLHYEVDVKETPSLDEIPEIVNPSINGLVEIGRGCCRGCEFCSVTLRPLRWYPLEKITREIDVNLRGGIGRVCLHAEDVMLFGSKNTTPNDEKIIQLHESVMRKCASLGWSHCSLAAVASKPQVFKKVAELIRQKQAWWGAEVGIETGSPRLAEKIMPAKAHPFKAEQWPEVVRTAMGLMHDNKLVPACTLIIGTPQETEDDLIKTIELVDDLKGVTSLIIPLFFVPMGKMKDEQWFQKAQLTPAHEELLKKCLQHNFIWLGKIIDLTFTGKGYASMLKALYQTFIKIIQYKAKKARIQI